MVSEVEKVRLRTKLEMEPRSRTIDSTSIVHKNSLYPFEHELFLTISVQKKRTNSKMLFPKYVTFSFD